MSHTTIPCAKRKSPKTKANELEKNASCNTTRPPQTHECMFTLSHRAPLYSRERPLLMMTMTRMVLSTSTSRAFIDIIIFVLVRYVRLLILHIQFCQHPAAHEHCAGLEFLNGRLLRQCGRVSVIWEVTESLGRAALCNDRLVILLQVVVRGHLC